MVSRMGLWSHGWRHRPSAARVAPRRGFGPDERGSAAVEFGLIAIPFFAIIFAIVEAALAFWSQQILDTALNDTVRQLYTGQYQQGTGSSGTTAQQLANLKQTLCYPNGVKRTTIFNCANLVIDVRSWTFTSTLPASPIKNGQLDPTFGQYASPGPDQIVLVRAAVEYPVYVKLLNPNQSNLSDGNRLLVASAAFQTEPYQ